MTVWHVVAWDRSLGRGRVAHADLGERAFDADVATTDKLALGEPVAVTLSDDGRRVRRLEPVRSGETSASDPRVALRPAGIFMFAMLDNDARTALGAAIDRGWQGERLPMAVYPNFLTIEGYATVFQQDARFFAVEARLASILAAHFGAAQTALMQAMVSPIPWEVNAAIEAIKAHGDPGPGYQRLHAVVARLPIDWERAGRTGPESLVGELFPRLPGWRGMLNGTPRWFGEGRSLEPTLWATMDRAGLVIEGRVHLPAWNAWWPVFADGLHALPFARNA